MDFKILKVEMRANRRQDPVQGGGGGGTGVEGGVCAWNDPEN